MFPILKQSLEFFSYKHLATLVVCLAVCCASSAFRRQQTNCQPDRVIFNSLFFAPNHPIVKWATHCIPVSLGMFYMTPPFFLPALDRLYVPCTLLAV